LKKLLTFVIGYTILLKKKRYKCFFERIFYNFTAYRLIKFNILMKKLYFLLITILITAVSFGQVIITEIADPNNNSSARYVEIYNPTASPVDLTDWELRRWTNGNTNPQSTGIDLSSIGSLGAGSFAIIAANSTEFTSVYGFSPDIDAGTGGAADSNGDDQIAIFDPSDTTIDIFGVPEEDGSGTCHEFEDGRAERKGGVTTSKSTWNEADWNVWADSSISGCTRVINSAQDAPGIFDPGTWIGTSTEPALTISSPSEGSTLAPTASTSMDVTFTVQNFSVASNGGDGHIHYNVDNGSTVMQFDTSTITLTGLSVGAHSIFMELVDDNHTPINPAVNSTVNFSIASFLAVSTITSLRAGTEGDYYELTGESIITYTRTSRNQKYIEDSPTTKKNNKIASGSGILIDDNDGIITSAYNVGDGIPGIKGRLSSFNGVLQFVPLEDPGTASSTGNTVTPEVVTASELVANWENYESELVEIKAATFVGAAGNFASGTNYTINDGTSDLTFRTNFSEADYIGTAIPTIAQNLVVLVGEFNGAPQVTARALSDVTLRVERNAINGFRLYPNPVTNGVLRINTLDNAQKSIKIYDLLGKQILSKRMTGQELNVSRLNTGIYILKVSENGKTVTRKLVIK